MNSINEIYGSQILFLFISFMFHQEEKFTARWYPTRKSGDEIRTKPTHIGGFKERGTELKREQLDGLYLCEG